MYSMNNLRVIINCIREFKFFVQGMVREIGIFQDCVKLFFLVIEIKFQVDFDEDVK